MQSIRKWTASTQSLFFATLAFFSPLVSSSKLGSTCRQTSFFASSASSMQWRVGSIVNFFEFLILCTVCIQIFLIFDTISHRGVDPPCGSLCSGSDQNMSGRIYGELNTHIAAGIPPTADRPLR